MIVQATFQKPTAMTYSEFKGRIGVEVCLSGGGFFDRIFGVRIETPYLAQELAARMREEFPEATVNCLIED